MTSGQVHLFPDWGTILWTVVNLFMLVAILGLIILAVVYVVRLSRKVDRIEAELKKRDK